MRACRAFGRIDWFDRRIQRVNGALGFHSERAAVVRARRDDNNAKAGEDAKTERSNATAAAAATKTCTEFLCHPRSHVHSVVRASLCASGALCVQS